MALQLAYLAVLFAFSSGALALAANRHRALLRLVVFPAFGLSGLSATGAGLSALVTGTVSHATLPLGLPWQPWEIHLDGLAALFLLIIGSVATAVAIYGPGYVREFKHQRHSLAMLGGFSGLFLAGMLLVVLAADAFLFMVAWELMSLSSYFLVAFQHENAANRRAAFIYLLMAHVGGLCILLGYGVLAHFGGGFDFAAMRAAQLPPQWATLAFALAFIGFGMKAGLVPLHAWLPEAHPVAPSHVSALMSGVMLKVAIYGFVRVSFDLIGEVQTAWGVTALLIGSVSALLGVLYAMLQTDLKRLLAYSSIENVGLIFVALGLSMVFLGSGHPVLGRLGLMAALLHALNHALFKSLLFLGAGAVLQNSHERDMERMGGLLKRMPHTGLFFLVGCISIASLPPLNGFVSEWLTFQTALQGLVLDNGVLRILIPVTAAMLALTAALAAATFVKAYGVTFLGQPRSRHARHARQSGLGMRIAQALLAGLCVLSGVLATPLLDLLDQIPRQLLGGGLTQAVAHGWLWLTPVDAATSSYSAPLVLGAIVATWTLAWLLTRRRGGATRAVERPWDCGFGPLGPRMQYTATAFAMPIRRIFQPVWAIEERVERHEDENGRPQSLRYQLLVGDHAWQRLYEPLGRAVLAAARRVTRLQTGNIRTYLAYSFFTLLVLLWLIT